MIQFNSIIWLNSTIEFNSLQVSSTSPQGPPQTVEAAAQGMLRRPSWSESSNWSEPNSVVELNWIVELKYTNVQNINYETLIYNKTFWKVAKIMDCWEYICVCLVCFVLYIILYINILYIDTYKGSILSILSILFDSQFNAVRRNQPN